MYNQIPKYQLGKAIKLFEEVISKTKGKDPVRYLQNLSNFLGKAPEHAELKNGLSALKGLYAKGIKYDKSKGVTEGTNKEFYEAIKKIAEERRKLGSYKERKAKFWENREKAKEIANKANKPTTETTKPAEQTAAPGPVPGSTLSGWWKKSKEWINNHPKTIIGAPIIAASGIGRDALHGLGTLYSARPFTSGTSEENKDKKYLEINGTKIPITMVENGNFILSSDQGENQTATSVGDDIDALIAGASTPISTSTPAATQQANDTSQPDYNSINDLFEDYR